MLDLFFNKLFMKPNKELLLNTYFIKFVTGFYKKFQIIILVNYNFS